MKLTVAMRVVGGFAIITSLLIVMGIFSLATLDDIDDATEEVSNLAFPTVSGSSQLKVSFLNMGRLTAEAYYGDGLNSLDEKSEAFTNSQSNFENEFNTLKQVVSQESDLKASLAEVDSIYEDYKVNVLKLFDSRKADLAMRDTLRGQIGDIEDNADDTSSLILDSLTLTKFKIVPNLPRLQN